MGGEPVLEGWDLPWREEGSAPEGPRPRRSGGTGLRMGLLEPSRVSPSEPAGSARGQALEPGAPGGKVLPVLAELRERASEAGTVFI